MGMGIKKYSLGVEALKAIAFIGFCILVMQVAMFAALLYVGWDLNSKESEIIDNVVEILKTQVYPDVINSVQHAYLHGECAAHELELTAQCICSAVSMHFSLPPALCLGLGACSRGGVDGVISRCDLDHVLAVDTSDVEDWVESPSSW